MKASGRNGNNNEKMVMDMVRIADVLGYACPVGMEEDSGASEGGS